MVCLRWFYPTVQEARGVSYLTETLHGALFTDAWSKKQAVTRCFSLPCLTATVAIWLAKNGYIYIYVYKCTFFATELLTSLVRWQHSLVWSAFWLNCHYRSFPIFYLQNITSKNNNKNIQKQPQHVSESQFLSHFPRTKVNLMPEADAGWCLWDKAYQKDRYLDPPVVVVKHGMFLPSFWSFCCIWGSHSFFSPFVPV